MIGTVLGVRGLMEAMAGIFLHESFIPIEGGEQVSLEQLEVGNISL